MVTRGKSVEVLSYAAGVLDSDGCFSVSRMGQAAMVRHRLLHPRYTGIVTVTNTSLHLLEWFVSEFGGYVKQRTQAKPHHKRTYNWSISNQAGSDFCEMIRPFLKVKGRQSEIIVELHESKNRYMARKGTPRVFIEGRLTGFPTPNEEIERREQLYQECKILNDDRRPHRLTETASRTDDVIVSSNGKPLEVEGIETIYPSS